MKPDVRKGVNAIKGLAANPRPVSSSSSSSAIQSLTTMRPNKNGDNKITTLTASLPGWSVTEKPSFGSDSDDPFDDDDSFTLDEETTIRATTPQQSTFSFSNLPSLGAGSTPKPLPGLLNNDDDDDIGGGSFGKISNTKDDDDDDLGDGLSWTLDSTENKDNDDDDIDTERTTTPRIYTKGTTTTKSTTTTEATTTTTSTKATTTTQTTTTTTAKPTTTTERSEPSSSTSFNLRLNDIEDLLNNIPTQSVLRTKTSTPVTTTTTTTKASKPPARPELNDDVTFLRQLVRINERRYIIKLKAHIDFVFIFSKNYWQAQRRQRSRSKQQPR